MRPRKPIVLLMHSEIDLSLWRMRLETSGANWQVKYRVLPALTLEAALDHLAANPVCCHVVTDCTCNGALRRLWTAGVKVLVIGGPPMVSADLLADAYEPAGPVLAARVLDRLRILTARRRGPGKSTSKDGKKQPARVPGATVDTTQPTHQEATAA